ncbi:hypothetical protein Y88_1478 [Novosphingobium nitrogenifigens DSM 19370]|uniref:MobA-like NTP transferase domain-containing protein n=1 Tax=Novosphingobium nitrogenifigens DSM 19370 TaxID=983920 RepID=F1Z7D4_9SPHN|nr:nucleotidyltransferase family protein [Novosphingobium nitrogenifigens]EGD59446.1 hypothetical protein Y88_1478 [Novosphingobium nitrogenifigens DSM 19370]
MAHDLSLIIAILGAGAGSRMGGGKPGIDLGGKPLGQWALDAAGALDGQVVFVCGPERAEFLDCIPTLVNPDPGRGMASSLVLAARHAQDLGAERLLLMLADMPFVSPETLRALVERTGRDEVTACRYPDGRLGPPACFDAGRIAPLLDLTGDMGARKLLNRPGFAQGLAVLDNELSDIDTPEDLTLARDQTLT